MMTLAEIRLKQNPILTHILLGLGQGSFVAERVFPRLPLGSSSAVLARLGDERFRKYNLRRAPGTPTKRVDIKYEGKVYTVAGCAVDVPIPRELIREADESRPLDVHGHLSVSQLAVVTANDILLLDYELSAADLATDPDSYAPGHVVDLAGSTKWSVDSGAPISDINEAANLIRKKTGRRPNQLTLSPDAFRAMKGNLEVQSYMSGEEWLVTLDALKDALQLKEIVVGDATWIDETDTPRDVWGNNAILQYVPEGRSDAAGAISLAEPAFGFTAVIEGHPFVETPHFSPSEKAWIYGATFERQAHVALSTAAVLFRNPL